MNLIKKALFWIVCTALVGLVCACWLCVKVMNRLTPSDMETRDINVDIRGLH